MDPLEQEQASNFDFAFDEALNGLLGDAGTEEEKPTEEKPTEEKPAEEKPTEEKPTEEKPAEEKPTEEKPAAATDPRDEEIARLKTQLAEKPKVEEPKDDPQARAQQEAEDKAKAKAAEELSKQAREEWADFKKDWAEPAAMMEKMYGAIMDNVQNIVEQALAHYHEQMVSPLVETSNLSANDRLLMKVREAHQDGPDLVSNGAVDAWIQTLPAWQQEAANRVLTTGAAEEVISLLDVYKKATGKAKKETKSSADPEAEAERQRKLRSMAAVNDRRTTSTSESDPNDFDGAFKQAIAGG